MCEKGIYMRARGCVMCIYFNREKTIIVVCLILGRKSVCEVSGVLRLNTQVTLYRLRVRVNISLNRKPV